MAAFGGDPGNVALVGESAGSMSIAALLASPAAAGLFHRAVLQSGPPATASPAWARRRAERLATLVGVDPDGLAALRRIPAGRLVEATRQLAAEAPADGGLPLPLLPVVDGGLLDRPPGDAVVDGSAACVPLLVGTTRDESTLFTAADALERRPRRRRGGAAPGPGHRAGRGGPGRRRLPPRPPRPRSAGDRPRPVERHHDGLRLPPAAPGRGGRPRQVPDRGRTPTCSRRSRPSWGDVRVVPRARHPFRVRNRGRAGRRPLHRIGPGGRAPSRRRCSGPGSPSPGTGDPSCDAVGEWPAYDTAAPAHHGPRPRGRESRRTPGPPSASPGRMSGSTSAPGTITSGTNRRVRGCSPMAEAGRLKRLQ